MQSNMPHTFNPLSSFMRQPKIYIKLPSNGNFWPKNSLVVSENNEYPVFSMTAKDELLLKVPDALMNGQAVVDVIQNCVPNIKNAWEIPNIDLDVILIAIRIASYGEQMSTPVTISDTFEFDYKIDLRTVLDSLYQTITWETTIPINENLTIFVRPVNYKQITKGSIQSFETQKIMQVANDENMPDEEKQRIFKESFRKLTEVTVDMITESIYRIDSSEGSTENPKFISDFINNSDKEIFDKVQKHLETLKEKNTIKPISVPVTEEMKQHGITSETVEVPLIFDASTFFE